jgi:hypothetical protein
VNVPSNAARHWTALTSIILAMSIIVIGGAVLDVQASPLGLSSSSSSSSSTSSPCCSAVAPATMATWRTNSSLS